MPATASHPIRVRLHHFNLRAIRPLDAWLEGQLLALAALRRIDEAIVHLVRHPNASPAYQVNIHLVTPGPDFSAESRDHTLRAALDKALTRLRSVVALRAARRLHQRRKDRASLAMRSPG